MRGGGGGREEERREEECKEIREKARRGQREDKIGGKSTVMEKIVEGDEWKEDRRRKRWSLPVHHI